MPTITAILHTHNDALRIARAIESLRPCDEVLVIDHGSTDETPGIAAQFGARVVAAGNQVFDTAEILGEAQHDWILCLQPTESVEEGLEASLLEWKFLDHPAERAFGVEILEETAQGWATPRIEIRLVHRRNAKWIDWRPQTEGEPMVLDGSLRRMRLP